MIRKRTLLITGRALKAIAVCAALVWGALFILALQFVTRAPTSGSGLRQPTISWSNHGLIHHVPPADYAFYDAVTSAAPFVTVGAIIALVLAQWLERQSQTVQ